MDWRDDGERRLIEAAREAAARAYCPYSRLRVGAAVLTTDGEIVAGCNVENASFGLTLCAERNAIFRAIARRGPIALARVVVYAPTPAPVPPCGACLQVIAEFGPGAEVLCVCDGPDPLRGGLDRFLPIRFTPGDLPTPP